MLQLRCFLYSASSRCSSASCSFYFGSHPSIFSVTFLQVSIVVCNHSSLPRRLCSLLSLRRILWMLSGSSQENRYGSRSIDRRTQTHGYTSPGMSLAPAFQCSAHLTTLLFFLSFFVRFFLFLLCLSVSTPAVSLSLSVHSNIANHLFLPLFCLCFFLLLLFCCSASVHSS